MEINRLELLNILNVFHQSTGIGAMFFDRRLHILAAVPGKNIFQDYLFIGMDQISDFLNSHFSESTSGEDQFYTCFLDAGMICNVSFYKYGATCFGAFVTQPVMIQQPGHAEIDRLLNQYDYTVKERNSLETALRKVPMIGYERIMPIGSVLHNLVLGMSEGRGVRQVVHRTEQHSQNQDKNRKPILYHTYLNQRRNRDYDYSLYVQLKELIGSGNTESLVEFLDRISLGMLQFEKLIEKDLIRSMKIGFIKACVMASIIAMDSGVHYDKALNLTDEAIFKLEKLNQITEIYDLAKDTMIAFTQAVSSRKKLPYSKPIRKVLEYISEHYTEKISLADLSQLTGLSMFYLSNLIKKETDLSLTENINRIRIEESKKLLSGSSISILEVAQLVGFRYQNHFASTFKKYTGLSPSEYRNNLGVERNASSNQISLDSPLPQMIEQLHSRISSMNGYYDYARIVEISTNKTWYCSPLNNSVPNPKICYDFWNKKEACPDCVLIRACTQDAPVFKVVDQGDEIFLVLGIPKNLGKSMYGIEIIKRVTGHFITVQDTGSNDESSLKDTQDCQIKGLSDSVNKKLAIRFNMNQINRIPFTLVAAYVDAADLGSDDDFEKRSLSIYREAALASFRSHEDSIDDYIGNIFIILLNKADENTADKIIRRINESFYMRLADLGIESKGIAVHYGRKAITAGISDPAALLKMALIDLHTHTSGSRRPNH